MTIYLIGCLITYILCKSIRYKSNDNEWEDVKITLLATLCSWVSVIIIFAVLICKFFNEILPKYFKNKKPPKWL